MQPPSHFRRKRFGHYLKHQLIWAWRESRLALIVLSGGFAVAFAYLQPWDKFSQHYDYLWHALPFALALGVVLCIYTSSMFKKERKPSSALLTLMLPITAFERWLAAWLISAILVPLVLIIGLGALYFVVMSMVLSQNFGLEFATFAPLLLGGYLKLNLWMLLVFWSFHGYFFFCGIALKGKWRFTLPYLGFALHLLLLIAAITGTPPIPSELPMWVDIQLYSFLQAPLVVSIFTGGRYTAFGKDNFALALTAQLVIWALTVGWWLASYVRLKRTQA
jgi:hypothetical protein